MGIFRVLAFPAERSPSSDEQMLWQQPKMQIREQRKEAGRAPRGQAAEGDELASGDDPHSKPVTGENVEFVPAIRSCSSKYEATWMG